MESFNSTISLQMLQFVLQLAAIVIAARMGGFVAQRFLKMPSVMGELLIGMAIGPFALGGLPIFRGQPLFPMPLHPVPGVASFPISPELYAIAMLASIVLLFLSGLETDLSTFLRYSVVGTAVGVGGVVFSFGLGDFCAIWFGVAKSPMDSSALFLGTVATATSVGITARILSEARKIDSPEGVTIMAGAVLDDVLGIVVLAIVVGMSRLETTTGAVIGRQALLIAGKALGFWVLCTTIGLLLARRFGQLLKLLRSPELIATVALGFALLLAGLSEMAGLAMIIGAYIMGLSLSRTDLVQLIQHELQGLHIAIVPVFFCIMGMLVDFHAIHGLLAFGLTYSVIAILAKLIGCGLPAWLMRFNLRGAFRIGLGMVPRGEVALIVAGIGLSSGAIDSDVFGVAIMMTMITSILAPPLLERSFRGKSGLKNDAGMDVATTQIILPLPSHDVAEFLIARLTNAFRNEEFLVYRHSPDVPSYQIRKDDMVFTLTLEDARITLTCSPRHEQVGRLILLEELLALEDVLQSIEHFRGKLMGNQLLAGLFDQSPGK